MVTRTICRRMHFNGVNTEYNAYGSFYKHWLQYFIRASVNSCKCTVLTSVEFVCGCEKSRQLKHEAM